MKRDKKPRLGTTKRWNTSEEHDPQQGPQETQDKSPPEPPEVDMMVEMMEVESRDGCPPDTVVAVGKEAPVHRPDDPGIVPGTPEWFPGASRDQINALVDAKERAARRLDHKISAISREMADLRSQQPGPRCRGDARLFQLGLEMVEKKAARAAVVEILITHKFERQLRREKLRDTAALEEGAAALRLVSSLGGP
jgi:hypothetical protein